MLDLFSDDSGAGVDRYRSLAVVAVSRSDLAAVRAAIAPCFGTTSSVEWKDLTGDSRKQRCARSLVATGVRLAAEGSISITILSWDLYDTRHAIPGRDDIGNTERMYYHAIADTARKRWAKTLSLHPDQTSALNFRKLQAFLNRTHMVKAKPEIISFLEESPERFSVDAVHEQDSRREPLVQLADLFAGMARTSLEQSVELKRWRTTEGQPTLLFSDVTDETITRGRRAKFEIIDATNTECKRCRIGVSLNRRGYFWTPNPKKPIHFWLWEPQGHYDKAPTNRSSATS